MSANCQNRPLISSTELRATGQRVIAPALTNIRLARIGVWRGKEPMYQEVE